MDEEGLDLMGPEPIKIQVADLIAARIKAGRYPPRRPIPGQHALAAEFGVARNTIRAAIEILIERGLVQAVPGKGTYVTEPKPETEDPEP
jgi:GntR family transcriptional regulator